MTCRVGGRSRLTVLAMQDHLQDWSRHQEKFRLVRTPSGLNTALWAPNYLAPGEPRALSACEFCGSLDGIRVMPRIQKLEIRLIVSFQPMWLTMSRTCGLLPISTMNIFSIGL